MVLKRLFMNLCNKKGCKLHESLQPLARMGSAYSLIFVRISQVFCYDIVLSVGQIPMVIW